jgi:hypothetical protein
MRLLNHRDTRCLLALAGLIGIACLQLFPLMSYAQNLGQQPAVGQAVQGTAGLFRALGYGFAPHNSFRGDRANPHGLNRSLRKSAPTATADASVSRKYWVDLGQGVG